MHFLVCLAALPLALGAGPSTNVVRNLHPDTSNRLASNRAALPDTAVAARDDLTWEWDEPPRETCTHIDELKMYFELASGYDAGTSHRVQVEFPNTDWQLHVIQDDAGPGFREWQGIDINGIAELSEIQLQLSIQVRQVGRAGYNKDAIQVASIKFRGHCVDSDTWFENNRFAVLNKAMPMKEVTPDSSLSGKKFVIWTGSLAPTDWFPRPACTYLRQLEVALELSDKYWSGTKNDIYLRVGDASPLLAQDPSRGEIYSSQISMMDAFDSSIVALATLTKIEVHNKGQSDDQFLPKELTLRGTCLGPSGTFVELKKQLDGWVSDKLEVDVNPAGWESRLA